MSQVDDFHYHVLPGMTFPTAHPTSIADCPICPETENPPTLFDRLALAEAKVAAIVALRDRLAADKTWDGRPDVVAYAYAELITVALAVEPPAVPS
jgi:hypothetical protein